MRWRHGRWPCPSLARTGWARTILLGRERAVDADAAARQGGRGWNPRLQLDILRIAGCRLDGGDQCRSRLDGATYDLGPCLGRHGDTGADDGRDAPGPLVRRDGPDGRAGAGRCHRGALRGGQGRDSGCDDVRRQGALVAWFERSDHDSHARPRVSRSPRGYRLGRRPRGSGRIRLNGTDELSRRYGDGGRDGALGPCLNRGPCRQSEGEGNENAPAPMDGHEGLPPSVETPSASRSAGATGRWRG